MSGADVVGFVQLVTVPPLAEPVQSYAQSFVNPGVGQTTASLKVIAIDVLVTTADTMVGVAYWKYPKASITRFTAAPWLA